MLLRKRNKLNYLYPMNSSIYVVLKKEITLVAVALAAQILLRVLVGNK